MRMADDAVEVEVEVEGALEGDGSAKPGLTALGRLAVLAQRQLHA